MTRRLIGYFRKSEFKMPKSCLLCSRSSLREFACHHCWTMASKDLPHEQNDEIFLVCVSRWMRSVACTTERSTRRRCSDVTYKRSEWPIYNGGTPWYASVSVNCNRTKDTATFLAGDPCFIYCYFWDIVETIKEILSKPNHWLVKGLVPRLSC